MKHDSLIGYVFASFLPGLFSISLLKAGPVPETVITEPVSVAQYDDAVVIYLHGFDAMRARYPELELSYRMILPDGTPADVRTLDLNEPWEKPGIILRKAGAEYAGIILSATSGSEVFFRRLYSLNGTLDPQTLVATLGQNAAIEPGQFLGTPPTILQPDLAALDLVTIGAAGRVENMDANTYLVKSNINYPLIDSGNNGALSLQTDDPADLTKRSIYIPMRSQLYDEDGNPDQFWHYLCEVPLDPDWLNGTEDLVIDLEADDIKVHWTQEEFLGNNILGTGNGGLGQATGTMSRDAGFNIYWSNVPSQILRFNPTTIGFEIPPVSVKDLMYEDRPTRDEVLGDGSQNLLGHYGSYRMIWNMNHITPRRMVFASVQNRRFNHGFFWAGMWTIPQDHWDDPVAFEAAFHFPVAAWPTAPHDFWGVLPEIGGPNYRLWQFQAYGDTLYVRPYPNSVGGPWRVDLNADGSVAAFGTEASGVFPDYDDALGKPVDATPFNAAGKITWSNYGVLIMTRTGLKEALTGIRDNSLAGQIEVNYDAIDHMLQNPVEFAPILDNIGGPSLAPGYMVTWLPGQDGQALGAAEYGYYLSRLDMNTPTPGEVDKTYLTLDSANPSLELPLKVGLGPYGHQWCNLDGDDWLYLGGYIGMTRFQYSDDGVPLQRFTMDKFDTRLATVYLDGANAIAGGAIKRYRFLQHGIDDLMFVTGTHTAARGGTAFSGGLMSFDKTQLNTRWKLSYMSRCYNTIKLRNRVVREADGSLLQEFCHTGWFNSNYVHTVPAEHVPANSDPKIFCYDYPSGGTMRDRMGFSVADLSGSYVLNDIAYSNDRRYLLIMQEGDRILTFDPQANRYIDGKQITFGGGIRISDRKRPSHSLLRAPDDRLFIYAAASENDTKATFIEVKVSPAGEISFVPHVELRYASSDDRIETWDSVFTYLPDYENDDGSYDLFLGQDYSDPDTDCRLIEDFIPPRRHQLERTLNVLSSGVGGVSITGTKPGATPYSAACTDGQNVSLTAQTSSGGYVFVEWQDEEGDSLGTNVTLPLTMENDRIVTAIYEEAPDLTDIDPASNTIDHQAQNYVVTVTSNTSWNVTSLPPWLSANPTSGTGNGVVTLTAQANGGTAPRNSTLSIGGQSHAVTQQGIPPLDAVTGVSASDGTYSEKIHITWQPVNGAEGYRVRRAAVDDFSQSAEIAQLGASEDVHDDTTIAAGSTFYYWVLAWRSSDGSGARGNSDPGRRAEDTGGNSAAEATVLNFLAETAHQAGHLEPGDSDWYAFTISPSRFVNIRTTGSLDTIGAIFRSGDLTAPVNSVEEDDDRGDGANFHFDGLLEAGDYFIQISGGGDNQSGSYELWIELDDPAVSRPDLHIGRSLWKLIGNDYYSVSGAGQTVTIRKRRSAVGYLRAENGGNARESLRVRGVRSKRKFRVKYFLLAGGPSNVTGAVGRGTYQTSVLDSGGHSDFKIKLALRRSDGASRKKVLQVQIFSTRQPAVQDLGRLVLRIAQPRNVR